MKCLKAIPLGDVTIVKTTSVTNKGDRRGRASPRPAFEDACGNSRSGAPLVSPAHSLPVASCFIIGYSRRGGVIQRNSRMSSFLLSRLTTTGALERVLRERLSEPLHLNFFSAFVAIFGSYRSKVYFDLAFRQYTAFICWTRRRGRPASTSIGFPLLNLASPAEPAF